MEGKIFGIIALTALFLFIGWVILTVGGGLTGIFEAEYAGSLCVGGIVTFLIVIWVAATLSD